MITIILINNNSPLIYSLIVRLKIIFSGPFILPSPISSVPISYYQKLNTTHPYLLSSPNRRHHNHTTKYLLQGAISEKTCSSTTPTQHHGQCCGDSRDGRRCQSISSSRPRCEFSSEKGIHSNSPRNGTASHQTPQ